MMSSPPSSSGCVGKAAVLCGQRKALKAKTQKALDKHTFFLFPFFFPNCATFSEANGGGVCQINVKADGWLSLVIEQQAETCAAVLVSSKNQCFEVLNCRPDAVAVQTEHNLFSSVTIQSHRAKICCNLT